MVRSPETLVARRRTIMTRHGQVCHSLFGPAHVVRMGDARKPLQVNLTLAARRGWAKVSHEQGASFTAVIEIIGLRFDSQKRLSPEMLKIIEQARRLDIERTRKH